MTVTTACPHNCLAAHFTGLSPEKIAMNRQGRSSDARGAAALQMARRLIETHGKAAVAELELAAGYSEAEIIDVVAVAVVALLPHFMNNLAGAEIDFPTCGACAGCLISRYRTAS